MLYSLIYIFNMKILGVVLSEFHRKEGFQMAAYDPPENPLTKEQFTLYSDFILPRNSFCGRVLALEFLADYFLVVYPILSKLPEEDQTYDRHIYYYSVSIIVDRRDYLNKQKQGLYKQAVTKLAKFIQVIEQTDHLVYLSFFQPEYVQYLTSILKRFRDDINSQNQCNLTHFCNHYTFINAYRPLFIQEEPEKKLSSATVPVATLTIEQIEMVQSDLGRQLLKYAIDGQFTIHKICRLHRDRKQNQIRAFYLKAAEKGIIYLLDIINLSNYYVLTDQIKEYLPDQPKNSSLSKIAASISINGQNIEPQELLSLYLQFNRVTPLNKIIQLNRRLLSKIDIQKLIRCGQICGFLKRIQQKVVYSQFPQPLVMSDTLKRLLQERGNHPNEQNLKEQSDKLAELLRTDLMNGLSLDEIAVTYDIDNERLLKLLNSQNRYIFKINGLV